MRIGLGAIGAVVGIAGTAASVRAAPSCSVEALNALHVPDVSVTEAEQRFAAGSLVGGGEAFAVGWRAAE